MANKKTSEELGMETNQAEQLDALLNQSTRMLNKNHDTEETDTQTEVIMAEKKGF